MTTHQAQPFRIGNGFDVHRLVEGRELWLCGIKLDHDKGLLGHSDADVAIHALCDALLGAAAQGDIGKLFPDNDPQFKGIDSKILLKRVIRHLESTGFALANCDITIMAEQPKIGPHVECMRQTLADCMGCDISQVSVKATTTEKLGFTGREEGIAAQAVALVTSI